MFVNADTYEFGIIEGVLESVRNKIKKLINVFATDSMESSPKFVH